MSAFHGLFSFDGIAGAGSITALLASGLSLGAAAIGAVIVVVTAMPCSPWP